MQHISLGINPCGGAHCEHGIVDTWVDDNGESGRDADVRGNVEKMHFEPISLCSREELEQLGISSGARVDSIRRDAVQPVNKKAVTLDKFEQSREYRFLFREMSACPTRR